MRLANKNISELVEGSEIDDAGATRPSEVTYGQARRQGGAGCSRLGRGSGVEKA